MTAKSGDTVIDGKSNIVNTDNDGKVALRLKLSYTFHRCIRLDRHPQDWDCIA